MAISYWWSGIFLTQGSKLCFLHWQSGSLPLCHLEGPNEVSEGPLFGKGNVHCRMPAQGHLTHNEVKITSLTTDFGCFSVNKWFEFLLRTRTRSGHQGRAAGVDGVQQDKRQERSPGGRDSHYLGVQNLQPSEYLFSISLFLY